MPRPPAGHGAARRSDRTAHARSIGERSVIDEVNAGTNTGAIDRTCDGDGGLLAGYAAAWIKRDHAVVLIADSRRARLELTSRAACRFRYAIRRAGRALSADQRAEIASCQVPRRRCLGLTVRAQAVDRRRRLRAATRRTGSALTRRELGQRPVRQRPQRQQLFARGCRRQRATPSTCAGRTAPAETATASRSPGSAARRRPTPAATPASSRSTFRLCAGARDVTGGSPAAVSRACSTASPINGTLSRAVARGIEVARDPVGAAFDLPAEARRWSHTAACTAIPTSTQMVVQAITTTSLISCASSRAGVVA